MDIFLGLVLSSHIGLSGDYNEVHPHIRGEFDNGIVVGSYYNSGKNTSIYVAKHYENSLGLYGEIGVVTGYEMYDVVPFVRVGKSFDNGWGVFMAPAIEGNTNTGIIVGFEYKLKIGES